MKPTRRQFLAAGAVAGAGTLAGCDQIPFIGGSGGIGEFKNWVPKAGKINSQNKTVGFNASSPSQIHGNKNNLNSLAYLTLQRQYQNRAGIDFKSIDMSLNVVGGQIYKGSFKAADVTSELESATGSDDAGKYSQDSSEGSYEIYIPSSADNADTAGEAYAVKNNTVLHTQRMGFGDNAKNPVEVATTLIGVGENGDARAVDDNDDFKTLSDNLSGTFASGSTRQEEVSGDAASVGNGMFKGMVASGASLSINGGSSKRTEVFVFGSEGDVDTDDIETYVERNDTNGGSWSYTQNVNVKQNGNAGIVTGKVSTDDNGFSNALSATGNNLGF